MVIVTQAFYDKMVEVVAATQAYSDAWAKWTAAGVNLTDGVVSSTTEQSAWAELNALNGTKTSLVQALKAMNEIDFGTFWEDPQFGGSLTHVKNMLAQLTVNSAGWDQPIDLNPGTNPTVPVDQEPGAPTNPNNTGGSQLPNLPNFNLSFLDGIKTTLAGWVGQASGLVDRTFQLAHWWLPWAALAIFLVTFLDFDAVFKSGPVKVDVGNKD